jgi:hypothetical protein
MVFQEQYSPHGPAWVCQNPDCGYRQFLRPLPSAAELIRASKEIQADARRTAMKSRAKAQQATRRIARTNKVIQKRRNTGS